MGKNKDNFQQKSDIEVRDYSELDDSLKTAALILKRDYLNYLPMFKVNDLSEKLSNRIITDYTRFYSVSKLVYNKDESFLEKLTTVARAASISNTSLVTMISSDGIKTNFWVGAVNKSYETNMTGIIGDTLEGCLHGNFPGSSIEKLSNEYVTKELEKFQDDYSVVSSISTVASLRDEDGEVEKYAQGIENLIEALKGKKYTILTIADPISNQESEIVLNSLEQLYSQLSIFEKTEMAMNENSSISNSEQNSKSYAQAIGTNTSISQSHTTQTGWNESEADSKSRSSNLGGAIKTVSILAAGATALTGNLPAAAAIYAVGSTGGELIGSKTTGKTKTYGNNNSISDAETIVTGENKVETETDTKATTISETLGSGRTLSFSVENKAVKNILDNIDSQIQRLKSCASYGSFSACTYVLSEDINVNMIASSLFNALISGDNSNVQVAKVNSWGVEDNDEYKVKQVLSFLGKLTHPRFSDYDDTMEYTPATLISGKELAIQLGFPKKSIQGLSVVNRVPFGRNVLSKTNDNNDEVSIGNLYNMGLIETNNEIKIDINSLTSHVFITGSTGTGKSNTSYKLIENLIKKNKDLRFMVIEPAKGEYKHAFYKHPQIKVNVYGTNPKKMELLRINPFSFPDDIHVLEHIDRLVEILNVCWPMYAAMPAILKNAIIKSYEKCGWDITNSYIPKKETVYPCFADVLQSVNEILESSAFSSDNKGDYIGALCTRIESLTTGLNGQILSSRETSTDDLFESNTIVDLSRIGSVETKSLIMGILVMKLQEYRMASESEPNQALKHIMILEEAHNLLKKTSTEQSAESSNLAGKSVEMLTNAIAEMRTYGESFFIIDQAPNLLDEAVIRNTNTKIVLRLPEASDREIVGKAMALSDEQILELAKLEKGCAAIYQNDWEEAVLCHFEQYQKCSNTKDSELFKYNGTQYIKSESDIKKALLEGIIDCVIEEDRELNIAKVEKAINEACIPFTTKQNILRIVHSDKKLNINDISGVVAELFDSKTVVESAKDAPDIETWNDSIICLADPNLRKMSKKYMDIFVQCLLVEQVKRNPEFEPFVESWKLKMKEV